MSRRHIQSLEQLRELENEIEQDAALERARDRDRRDGIGFDVLVMSHAPAIIELEPREVTGIKVNVWGQTIAVITASLRRFRVGDKVWIENPAWLTRGRFKYETLDTKPLKLAGVKKNGSNGGAK